MWHIVKINSSNAEAPSERNLYITVGISGSGKTSWTKGRFGGNTNSLIASADDFFDKGILLCGLVPCILNLNSVYSISITVNLDGTQEYAFDPSKLGLAHKQCYARVQAAINNPEILNICKILLLMSQ